MASPDINTKVNVEISRLSKFSFGLPGKAEAPSPMTEELPQPERSKARQKSTAGEAILAIVFLAAVVASIFGLNSKMVIQQFPQVAAVLHLSAASNQAVPQSGPNGTIKVWADRNTALYYCPGSAAYGRTQHGKYLSQAEAQAENFEPAIRKECAATSVAMLRKGPARR